MRFARLWPSLVLACSLSFAVAPATSVSAPWQDLTRIDVEAAYHLLADNDPAALPQVGDRTFTTALAEAHRRALARAAQVTNLEGHDATLAAFANAMGDGHIWSYGEFLPRTVKWAGIIVAKRGPNWVVAKDDRKITGRTLDGADILSCDGRPISQVAQRILPFHAVMSDEAEEVLRAGWLLIDDSNPFVHPPAACVFDRRGTHLDVALHWTRIGFVKLVRSEWPRPFGQAGFGVRRSGKGYWISIQALTPKAQPVLNAVRAEQTQIRAAPYVVVDLRGNGGGDDSYGRRLAQELYGTAYVDAILGPGVFAAGSCHEVYRASPQNIVALSEAAQVFRRTGDMIGAKAYHDAVARMKAAQAHGQALTGPLTCTPAPSVQHTAAPSRFKGKVFVVTDAACFSSCINVVGFFRKLGAVQVGENTGSDTHYAEVRQIVLPSGLSTFSTLQAIMPDYPPTIGPFVPRRIYGGNIADTPALEAWIRGLATKS